jgi:putative membrane protein
MSSPIRTPGRVDEDALPIGPSSQDDSKAAQNVASRSEKARKPGKVTAAAKPITETQESAAEPDESAALDEPKTSPWTTVFWLLTLTFSGWLLYEMTSAVMGAFEQFFWFGVALASAFIVLLLVFGRAIYFEVLAWRRADVLADRQSKITKAVSSNNLYMLREALAPTLSALRKRQPELVVEFESAAKARDIAADYLKQFDNIVLTQLDKQAEAVIRRSVLVGSATVAILPHPALDAIAVLWRAKILVQKLGVIYGLAPTGLSSIRLARHAITSAVMAGSAEKLGQVLSTQMTQDVFVKSLKPLGESALTATRLYRLGKLTQKACRPV